MKLKAVLPLGVILFAIFASSCAPPSTRIPGIPNASSSAENIVTAGLRSGDNSIDRNNIDALLNNPERPGLATGWGDEKESRMSRTYYVRSSSKPNGVDAIFYNDKEGINAIGNANRVGALQRAAGGLVEWGIKGGFGYLPAYKENGWGRRLVAGNKGGNYSIVVKNLSKSDLEIVTSVDGLDVQDGKTASFSKRGYVVAPGKSLEIEGFRTSSSKVAKFEFSSVSGSYANLKHGDTRNVGVIGIAVFTQKGVDPWKTREVQLRDNAKTFAEAP
ncbi:MAG: hypothetical protein ACSHX9_08395 [Luteolibacter sp.]